MNVRKLVEMLSHEDVDQTAEVKFQDLYAEPWPSVVTGMVYGRSVILTNEELS